MENRAISKSERESIRKELRELETLLASRPSLDELRLPQNREILRAMNRYAILKRRYWTSFPIAPESENQASEDSSAGALI